MSWREPRVLLEPSDYVLRNVGDMAMLQAAAERLRTLLPSATIQILTDDPEGLQALCPSAIPLPGHSRRLWLRKGFLEAALQRVMPASMASRVRRHIPRFLAEPIERRLGERSEFVRSVKRADLLVVAGMGGITDYFPEYARGVLKTIELAIGLGRRVALAGQGIGPLDDPELRTLAAAVLPKADLIALRERRASAPLLTSLGVESRRILVTGDDAIEMAHGLRAAELGDAIGINLRASTYSGVDSHAVAALGQAVREAAKGLGAALVPLPVSRVPGEEDMETLRLIIRDGDRALLDAPQIAMPADLIGEVQRCRIVITGSYHAGVFALANGIPAVGIAGTRYYEGKFEGLADMFGDGCAVVTIADEDYPGALRRAIDRLWDKADQRRPSLLAAAERQIESGHEAYSKIAHLILANTEVARPDAAIS